MALKTYLRFVSRKISEAVEAAAGKHGLAPRDYSLFGSYSEESDHIYLAFRTTKSVDERQLYRDVFEEIGRLGPEMKSVTMHIGLVIRVDLPEEEVECHATWVEHDEDITDLLMQRQRS